MSIGFYTEAWKIDGNCADRNIDPEMFELGPHSETNKINIPKAVEICQGCPVMDLCDSSHTDQEKTWMVVGGKAPTEFRPDAKEKFLHEKTGIWRYRYCPSGHDKKAHGVYENGGCIACSREKSNRRKHATMAA